MIGFALLVDSFARGAGLAVAVYWALKRKGER